MPTLASLGRGKVVSLQFSGFGKVRSEVGD